MTAGTKWGDFTSLKSDFKILVFLQLCSDVLHKMDATSPSCKDYNAELYKLYAQVVVRFAFHPFITYADSPQEAAMHEKERIAPQFNHSADGLVAEQWLILHPSSTNFSTSNLFEHVNNETYSKIFPSHKLTNY